MLELNEHFSIVGLFTTFEVFLRNTLLTLHWPGPAMLKCIRWMSLAGMKKEFAKIGVPIVPPGHEWEAIMGMKEVRNCITHAGSRPEKERAKKLASYKIPIDRSKMVLSDGYLPKSIDIVAGACNRIANDCQNAQREGQVTVKMPTVASLMDALLERPGGVTWSEPSKKAQALADKLRHKTKWDRLPGESSRPVP